MTNRDPDKEYKSPAEVLGFMCDQMLKMIRTATPAEIVAYEPATQRATVEPSLELLLTDGSSMPRAQALDVPVIFPAGGGWRITFPLTAGDEVLLVNCDRDISGFKQSGGRGRLPSDRVMAESDVVALAGFGFSTRPPETTSGVSIENADSSTAVTIDAGTIVLKAATVMVEGDLTVTGDASGSSPWSPPNP